MPIPKALDAVTDPMIDVTHLKEYVLIVPPLGHAINNNGMVMPSALTKVLTDTADGWKHFDKWIWIDGLFRQNAGKYEFHYSEIRGYYWVLIRSLRFMLKNYDQYRIVTQPPPREMLVGALVKLYADLIDMNINYIRRLRGRLVHKAVKSQDVAQYHSLINDSISFLKWVYLGLEGMRKALGDKLGDDDAGWMFDTIYYYYINFLLQIIIVDKITAPKELEAFDLDSVLNPMKDMIKKSSDITRGLICELLQAKVLFYVKKKKGKALKVLVKAEESLQTAQSDKALSSSSIDLNELFVEMGLLKLTIVHQDLTQPDTFREVFAQIKTLREGITQLLDADSKTDNSLKLCRLMIECYNALNQFTEKEMKFSELERLQGLEKLLSDLSEYHPLYSQIIVDASLEDAKGMGPASVDKWNSNLAKVSAIIADITKKRADFQAEIAVIEAQRQAYDTNFENILKKFKSNIKAKLIQNAPHLKSMASLKNKSAPEVPSSALPPEPEQPTISEHFMAHLKAHGLHAMPQCIDHYDAAIDKATVMLYMGDTYFYHQRVDQALHYYEQALILLNLQLERDEKLEAALKLMIGLTKDFLMSQVAMAEEYKKALEAERRGFIRYLGMQHLIKNKGYTEDQLNTPSKEIKNLITKNGDVLFKAIGERNREQGQGLSPKAQARLNIIQGIKQQNALLKKSDTLLKRLEEAHVHSENFPSLAVNPATVFAKPKGVKPKNAKALKKPTHSKRK